MVAKKFKEWRDFTYLGLTIKNSFKWDLHVDNIKKKILPYNFALYKLKSILPKKSLILIYYIIPIYTLNWFISILSGTDALNIR